MFIVTAVTAENFPQADNAAWYVSKNVTYFATATEPFQRFDPLWVIAAHALKERAPVKIHTSYVPAAGWLKAYDGLAKIADVQGVKLARQEGASARPANKSQRVALDPEKFGSARPTEGEKVVDDIRNPGPQPNDDQKDAVAHGIKTLPRLYVMAALLIEKAQNKAVVALIADSCGSVRSVGAKGPYEAGFLHAEVKAILKLRGELPANGLIATTLKPCVMCGGLMEALDPTGQRIKVYARDDAGDAAKWDKVLGGPVQGCVALDKDTQNCKSFKLDEKSQNKPFSKLFDEAWKATDKNVIPPEATKEWFQDWLKPYHPKDPLFWRTKETKKKVERKDVADLKKEITGIGELEQYIGRTDAKKLGQNTSILKDDLDKLKASWKEYHEGKKKDFSPDRLIHYIAFGHESTLLRDEAAEVMRKKYRRYGLLEGSKKDPLKTNENVAKVLEHLKTVMTEQKVKIA